MSKNRKHSFTPLQTIAVFNWRISKSHFNESLLLGILLLLGCFGFCCIHKCIQQSDLLSMPALNTHIMTDSASNSHVFIE